MLEDEDAEGLECGDRVWESLKEVRREIEAEEVREAFETLNRAQLIASESEGLETRGRRREGGKGREDEEVLFKAEMEEGGREGCVCGKEGCGKFRETAVREREALERHV